MVPQRQRTRSIEVASLAGIGVGVAVLALYVVAGLLVADWSLGEFLTHLTLEAVGSLLLAGAIAVACFAVPVAAYLHFRLVSPLVVLSVAGLGWLGYGAATGILTARTVFGLAIYAMFLAPVYLVLYVVAGWIEHRVR